jgi:L-fuconolactonase
MNIDSHQHFWRYASERHSWITEEMAILRRDFMPEDLIPELRFNRMHGCIAVQTDQSVGENAFLLDLAENHKVVQGVVGWVNLCSPMLSEELERFSKFEKLCGFRHIAQSEADDRFLVREDVVRGIRQLQKYHFTFDILIYPRQLPAAIELVEKIPEQRFVLDHMAKPEIRAGEIKQWAKQMQRLAANRNVYCKASGMVTEADWRKWRGSDFKPYLDVVFEAFGAERIMFGSDWPVCLLAGNYAKVKELVSNYVAQLPIEQQKKIFGLNAISFYGLKIPSPESATV